VLTAVESRSEERAWIDDVLDQHFACSATFLTNLEDQKQEEEDAGVYVTSEFLGFESEHLLSLSSQTSRQSTDKWSQALAKALATQNALANVDRKRADWEKHAENGLELLFERFAISVNSSTFFKYVQCLPPR